MEGGADNDDPSCSGLAKTKRHDCAFDKYLSGTNTAARGDPTAFGNLARRGRGRDAMKVGGVREKEKLRRQQLTMMQNHHDVFFPSQGLSSSNHT